MARASTSPSCSMPSCLATSTRSLLSWRALLRLGISLWRSMGDLCLTSGGEHGKVRVGKIFIEAPQLLLIIKGLLAIERDEIHLQKRLFDAQFIITGTRMYHLYRSFFSFGRGPAAAFFSTETVHMPLKSLVGASKHHREIMEKFVERYCPEAFSSADTAYVLAYSVIMLNTDAHNPMVKNKMSPDDFIRNNHGIDDGKDLPEEYLKSLFDRISRNEIKMKENDEAPQQKTGWFNSILNIVIRKRGEENMETSDDLIRHMQEQFKEKAHGFGFKGGMRDVDSLASVPDRSK
ncbi:hypothetical protein V8G54_009108 [Vigna mungo]|uniref:SEC7 domain-containing protein n=1 Tax=Vigna mungo TaxID=3915 RepID=A0AAQ3S547_VIGMU